MRLFEFFSYIFGREERIERYRDVISRMSILLDAYEGVLDEKVREICELKAENERLRGALGKGAGLGRLNALSCV